MPNGTRRAHTRTLANGRKVKVGQAGIKAPNKAAVLAVIGAGLLTSLAIGGGTMALGGGVLVGIGLLALWANRETFRNRPAKSTGRLPDAHRPTASATEVAVSVAAQRIQLALARRGQPKNADTAWCTERVTCHAAAHKTDCPRYR